VDVPSDVATKYRATLEGADVLLGGVSDVRPIEESCEPTERFAVVRVTDQGIGIAPEHQERIFGRFERAVSEHNYAGLGLGLWIAREIVDAHGGNLAVASEPGAGSTFLLELPYDQEGPSG
jgi:two-component system, LuxR family, sensor kinase FixL